MEATMYMLLISSIILILIFLAVLNIFYSKSLETKKWMFIGKIKVEKSNITKISIS